MLAKLPKQGRVLYIGFALSLPPVSRKDKQVRLIDENKLPKGSTRLSLVIIEEIDADAARDLEYVLIAIP